MNQNCDGKTIGVGARSTLGGHDIFARKKYALKINKMPGFYVILARKITKTRIFIIYFPKS